MEAGGEADDMSTNSKMPHTLHTYRTVHELEGAIPAPPPEVSAAHENLARVAEAQNLPQRKAGLSELRAWRVTTAGLSCPERPEPRGEGEGEELKKALAAPHRLYCTSQFLAIAKVVCPELYAHARSCAMNIQGADLLDLINTLGVPAYGHAVHACWYDGLTPEITPRGLVCGEIPTPGLVRS